MNYRELHKQLKRFFCTLGTFFGLSLSIGLLSEEVQAVVFQAENYNGYNDTTTGNNGGAYRNDNVDIETTTDVGGGYNIGWIAAGEWWSYNNFSVPKTGSYTIRMRVASPSGATASVDLNGGSIQLANFVIPSTGGWQSWVTVSRTLTLNAGNYNLGVFAQTAGWNFNWIEVVSNATSSASSSSSSSSSSAINLGLVQAENWSAMYGVATEPCADTNGGLDVGAINDGDWMDYRINVAKAGTYTVQFRVASALSSGIIQLRDTNGAVLGSVNVPNTGGWQTWSTINTSVNLPAGAQTLRLYALTGNWNINWINFVGLPVISGRIIYHSYSDYSAWDSQLKMLDLSNNQLTCLSCGWSNVIHSMNAHFSPDGSKIVFMGAATGTQNWDIWLYSFGSSQPINLTNSGGLTRNEDPKFSPDGQKIIIKVGQNGAYSLKEINLSGGLLNTILNGPGEKSMPYYTADGSKIVYTYGSTAAAFDMYIVNVDGSNNIPIANLTTPNWSEYFPSVKDANSFYFSRWVSPTDHHDQIYLSDYNGNITSMPFNEPTGDYSDAFPVGSRYVLVSSSRAGSIGKYDEYIADTVSGQMWSLNQFNALANTVNSELGGTYTPIP